VAAPEELRSFASLREPLVAALLEHLPEAVVVAEARTRRIVLVNRAARELYPDDALLGSDVEAYLSQEAFHLDGRRVELEDRPLQRALRHGVATAGDADWHTVEVRAVPMRDEGGKLIGAVSTSHDVTDQDRRERADREFLANAAHQLRNPIAAIRGAIEVLEAGAKEDPPTRDRFLAHIERESARLMRLGRALLLLARAQSRVEEPRRQIVQVEPLLRDLASRLNPPAGIAVEVDCAPDVAVMSSPELLEEALVCLADNAVRFTEVGAVRLIARRDGDSVHVEIADDGPGISQEVQSRMYGRFYRGGEGPGFGLGLAIAAESADAIGARLEIASRPGGGTSAKLILPAVGIVRT
jgi:PAS domain S-box-containing protein